MARFAYGGQALMEGVLMRGRDAIGVAVRGPDGQIFGAQEPLNSVLHRNRFARAPFFRGVVVLYETLVIGTRWLMRSGSLAAAGEGVAMGGRAVALTFIVTIVFALGLFVLLPLLAAQGATNAMVNGGNALVQHLIEAFIRIAIFVGYLLVVSRSPDIRRVFQYHGAEHMTIHALEHELPLTVDNARRYPTAHPRCGTEFLVVFIIVSILLFSLLAGQDLLRQHRRPHPAHPGRRGGRLRGAPLGRQAARELGRALAVPARHLAPGHHHQAARRRHDRGRHRVHARGARGERRDRPGRQPGPGAGADARRQGPGP